MRLSSPLAAGGARRRYRRSTFGSLVALLGVAVAVLCAVVDAASVSEKDGGVHVCADFPGRIVAVKGFATRRIAFGRLRSFGVQTVITDGAASEPYGADATAEPHLSTARVVEDPVLRPYPESVQQRSAPQSLMPALRPSIEVTAATVRAAAAAAGADTNPAATAATTPPDTRLLGSSASIGSVAESNDSAVAAPDPDNRDEPPSGSSAMDAEDVDGEDAIMADADSDAEPAFDDMTLLSMAEQSRKVFTNTTFIIVRHGEKLTWPDGKAPSRGAKKRYVDDTLLSAKGHERAFALVGYFLHRKEMTDLLKDRPLTTIIAQASDPRPNAAGKSQRPYQTIAPLLAALTAAAQTLPVSPAPFGHASAATVTGVLRADGTVDHGDPVDAATAAERGGIADHAPAIAKLPVDHLPFFKRDLVTMVRRLHAEAHRYTGATVLLSGAHQYFREIAIALGADATRVPAKWPGKRFDVTWVIDPEDPHRFRQYAQRLLWDDRSKVIKL